MFAKFAAAIALTTVLGIAGCSDQTVVKEKEVKTSDDGSKTKVKETTVKENPDGSTTKTEKKTETKTETK